MGLYSKKSLELLCQLIKRDNPQFTNPLDAQSVMVLSGPLTSGLGSSGRNARIILNGIGGHGIVGKKEFFYDRINLTRLFTGITVVFNAAGNSKTYADLLPALNVQYGLGLEATDLSNGTTKLPYGYTPTQVTLNIAGTSVAYTGSLSVTWTRTPVGTFPDSGPGTKIMLIGDMQEGYFGVVPESDLFTSADMLAKINEGQDTAIGTATALPATRHWYKFARDGKIVYLASYNQINIRWQDLYACGAAYETTVPLSDQYPPVGVGKKVQHLAMRKLELGREWFLSPCMPRLSEITRWDYAAINQAPDPTGDVARLFAKIATSGGFATGEWDGQTIDATGFWVSTTSLKDPTKAFGSGMTGINQGMYDMLTYTGGWRPMLELVNPSTITMPLESFSGTSTGALKKPLVFIEADTGDVLLIVSDVEWQIDGNLARPLVSFEKTPLLQVYDQEWERAIGVSPALVSLATDPVLGVQHPTWNKLLRVPVVKLSSNYKEVIAVDLRTADGELNGFN